MARLRPEESLGGRTTRIASAPSQVQLPPQAYTSACEGPPGGEQMSRPKRKGRGSKPQWAAQAQKEIQEQIVQAESDRAMLNRRALDNEDTSDEIRDAHADAEESLQELAIADVHMADLIYEIENGPPDDEYPPMRRADEGS